LSLCLSRCKLCKIDCTTEQNFRAHIGGKKHEAKKLAILEGKNNARGESSGNYNRRNTNQNRNHSLNESRESDCEVVRQEGEASGSALARETESSVKSAEPSNGSDGLIDLTSDD
jgi:Zinc-finger of C2H2 type